MQEINIIKPSTIYVKFNKPLPKHFIVNDNKEKLYFERFLDGKTPRIRFNIPYPLGVYTIITDCEVVKIDNIKIPNLKINLPPYERNRVKDIQIIDNPFLNGTPMRIFTNDGIIEKGRKFYNYPKPMRVFFTLHEIAHLFYKTEKYCDLFAMAHFLEMGYNMSTAMYCLTNGLRRTPQNFDRVKYVYQKVMQ